MQLLLSVLCLVHRLSFVLGRRYASSRAGLSARSPLASCRSSYSCRSSIVCRHSSRGLTTSALSSGTAAVRTGTGTGSGIEAAASLSPAGIPRDPQRLQREVGRLSAVLAPAKHLVAITGAGISTCSGIPDYRGPNGSYNRGHKPMSHSEFVSSENARKRYWSRSMVGWSNFSAAKPNDAHYSLALLESEGLLKHLITQNVDRLHQQAGSASVTDLHGRIDRAKCLNCGSATSRRIVQQQLCGLNPEFAERLSNIDVSAETRADGDVEIGIQDYSKVISD